MWICKYCDTKNDSGDLYCTCCGAKNDSGHPTDGYGFTGIIPDTGNSHSRQDRDGQFSQRKDETQHLHGDQQSFRLQDEVHVPAALDVQPVPAPVVRNILHYLWMLLCSVFFVFTPTGFMVTAFLFFVPGQLLLAPLQSVLMKAGMNSNALQMFLLFYGLCAVVAFIIGVTADRKEAEYGKQFRAWTDGNTLICSWPAQIISGGERWALALDRKWIASGASGSTVRIPLPGDRAEKVTLVKFTCGKVEDRIPKEIKGITWLSEAVLKYQ